MPTKTELFITDQRMLQLMDYCISNKIRDVNSQLAWCEKIGISRTNIYNIRNGLRQFTVEHILQACKAFNVSADYIFGLSNEMSKPSSNKTPMERLKEAVNELENMIA